MNIYTVYFKFAHVIFLLKFFAINPKYKNLISDGMIFTI